MHDFIDPVVPKAIPYGVYDAGGKESLTGKLTLQFSLKCSVKQECYFLLKKNLSLSSKFSTYVCMSNLNSSSSA